MDWTRRSAMSAWCILAAACGLAAAAAEPLRVGMELSYPPFEMTDPHGRPAGVSVKLAEALAAHLARPVIIENLAFDGLIPALKAGHVDCVISSMTATPERAKSIAFSARANRPTSRSMPAMRPCGMATPCPRPQRAGAPRSRPLANR